MYYIYKYPFILIHENWYMNLITLLLFFTYLKRALGLKWEFLGDASHILSVTRKKKKKTIEIGCVIENIYCS